MTFNKWFNKKLIEFERMDNAKNKFILHNIEQFVNVKDLPLGDILKKLRPVIIKIEKKVGILPNRPNKPKPTPKPSVPTQPSIPKPDTPAAPINYDPINNISR